MGIEQSQTGIIYGQSSLSEGVFSAVPQGLILGPVPFNICINDLEENKQTNKTFTVRVFNHWKNFPCLVVDFPALDILKERLDFFL